MSEDKQFQHTNRLSLVSSLQPSATAPAWCLMGVASPPSVEFWRVRPATKSRKKASISVTLRYGAHCASGLALTQAMVDFIFVITRAERTPLEVADIMALQVGFTIATEGEPFDGDDDGSKSCRVAPYRLSEYSQHCLRKDHMVPRETGRELRKYMRRGTDPDTCAAILKYLADSKWRGAPKLLVPSDSGEWLRQSVSGNCRRVFARIEKVSPSLAHYLRCNIALGARIFYTGVRFEPVLGSGFDLSNWRRAAA